MRQPSFIQYAYLDLKDDEAVNHFYEALKEEVEANPRILTLHIFKTRSPGLQNEIIKVLDVWHTNTVRKAGIDEWLQKHRPTKVFRADEGDELGTEEVYYYELKNADTRGLLIEQITEAMVEGKKIQKCAAEDCERYFIPTPRGRNQEYCSRQCYERIRSRKRRAKKVA